MKRKYIKPRLWLVRIGDDIAAGDGNLYESTGYTYGPGVGGGDDPYDGEFDVKGDQGLWAEDCGTGVWKDMW